MPTATPRPSPTPLPSQWELLADGGVGVIEVAFNRIVDEHVTPVDEAAVLSAGWSGIQSVANTADLPVPPSLSLTGDRASDMAQFRASWHRLAPELRGYPPTRWTAISAMARSLNDCHTYFLGPSVGNSAPDDSEDRALGGFGMTLTGQPAVVAEVETNPWSPAAAAGVKPGDTILSIDGEDTTKMHPLELLILLEGGEEDSRADIRVRRPGEAEPIDVLLSRSAYAPKNLQAKVIDGDVGYVRIHDWGDRAITNQLRDALARFDKNHVKKWIIDLRGNPGGIISPATISLFIPNGVAIRARQRNGTIDDDVANGDLLPNLKPLDVLVDNGSASMSEIFALALQEHHTGYLIGTKTDGCIGGTLIDDIGDGSGLAVTFETMLGPVTGAELNGIGVTPDQIVDRGVDDIVAGRDPQLQAAIEHLNAQ